MSHLSIKISTDNAAFDGAPELEVARILRELADYMDSFGEMDKTLLDVNGNRVGSAAYFNNE